MDSIKGFIKRYIFYDDRSRFGIIRLENGATVTGIIPKYGQGLQVEFFGEWSEHPKYGKQFNFKNFKIEFPSATADLVKLLGSGIIKGIGEKLAKDIIDAFGEASLDIMENNPGELRKIKGIGEKKIERISKSWEGKKNSIELGLFLNKHGIPYSYAAKIENTFGESSLSVIKKNPYKLVNSVWGIGFKEADAIAHKIGFEEDDPVRIKSGILYILEKAAGEGHVFLAFQDLTAECISVLGYEPAFHDRILDEMENNSEIIITENKVYLSGLYFYERGIEENIRRINSSGFKHLSLTKSDIHKLQRVYSSEQIDAIEKSLRHKIFILTGGPGTGKTETLKGIINIYLKKTGKILLAAPTGRAAKRMTEIIGMEARTIHRLLEYNPVYESFNFNADNRLDADLLIVDEVSMIDTALMFRLTEAIGDNTNLILVGDINQLPSIGPGNVLKDLIESGLLAVTALEKIFRQAEHSGIIKFAHTVLSGNTNLPGPGSTRDFIFIEENNEEKIPELILNLCRGILPTKYKFDPVNDVQILCPVHKGINGTVNYNKMLQKALNKNRVVFKSGQFEYMEGDKVMQLSNNYGKDIYNGDWGFILPVKKDKVFHIRFNGRTIEFTEDDFEQLTLAYSITVHKSQGSEYPCVILPMVGSHFVMLQRNLLYTAVTRAKNMVIIIGSKKALNTAINNNRITARNTSLFKESGGTRKYIPMDF